MAMNHTLSCLVYTSFHYHESLSWLEDFGFHYTLITGLSLELLLDILLLLCNNGDPVGLDLQIWPLDMLRRFIDEMGFGVV